MAPKRSTVYIRESSWQYSPAVWWSFIKIGTLCVVAGVIIAVIIMNNGAKKAPSDKVDLAKVCSAASK